MESGVMHGVYGHNRLGQSERRPGLRAYALEDLPRVSR